MMTLLVTAGGESFVFSIDYGTSYLFSRKLQGQWLAHAGPLWLAYIYIYDIKLQGIYCSHMFGFFQLCMFWFIWSKMLSANPSPLLMPHGKRLPSIEQSKQTKGYTICVALIHNSIDLSL